MKAQLAIFGILALCGTASAAAGCPVLSFGVSKLGHHKDNHYFQLRYPHEQNMEGPSFSIGCRFGRWSVHYEYVGHGETMGYADPDDGNYNPDLKSSTACKKKCLHSHYTELPYWHGEGEIHGISVMYVLVKFWHGWRIEFGGLAFRPTWEQHVYGWYPAGYPQYRSNITVKHKPTISIAPAVNISIPLSETWKNVRFTAKFRGPLNQGGDFAPNFHGISTMLGIEVHL